MSQYANRLQELMTTLQWKEEIVITSFIIAELVICNQFLLGIKNQPLHQMLRERLKLEPCLMMDHVLKEAITLEKEEQVEMPQCERMTWSNA